MSPRNKPSDTTTTTPEPELAPRTREAWQLMRTMLDDLTHVIEADAETELELMEGLRALARIGALCTSITVDGDPELPYFQPLATPLRSLGGASPYITTDLAAIDGRLRYRIRGRRGSVTSLGFQVLAGRGLAPRRIAAHLSNDELPVLPDGDFEIVLAHREPPPHHCQAAVWLAIPDDASAVIACQHVGHPVYEDPATYAIEPLDRPSPPAPPHDHTLAERLEELAWGMARLSTVHRTVVPELLETPNQLAAVPTGDLASGASTAPDDMCLMGMFRLAPDDALVIDTLPPASRWWSIALENIWHECFDMRSRSTAASNATAVARPDGSVRFVIAARDPGAPATNFLDTGGRHRGFVTLRWLDGAEASPIAMHVLPLAAVPLLD